MGSRESEHRWRSKQRDRNHSADRWSSRSLRACEHTWTTSWCTSGWPGCCKRWRVSTQLGTSECLTRIWRPRGSTKKLQRNALDLASIKNKQTAYLFRDFCTLPPLPASVCILAFGQTSMTHNWAYPQSTNEPPSITEYVSPLSIQQ